MKFSCSVLLLMSLGVFQAQARPEISVPEKVEISQRETLRLSDVAVLTSGHPELLAFLDTIILRQDARDLLLSQTLKASEILNPLRLAVANNEMLKKANPVFKIPSQVHVDFSSSPISKQEVERKILNVMKTRCGECEFKVTLQSTPVVGHRGWEIDFSQFSPRGGFLLPVKDNLGGGVKWISGTLQVSRLTPILQRFVQQGERLQISDVQMQMSDVTFVKDGALKLEDLQGQMAARSLTAGSAISLNDLKREPAALKGQMVKALLNEEGFELSLPLLAEDSGFVGDTIKLRNLETKKILSGEVIEKGVVKLQ